MTITYGTRLQEPADHMYVGISADEAKRCVAEICRIATATGQTDLAYEHTRAIADALVSRMTIAPDPPVRSLASETTADGGVIRLEYWPHDGYVLWYHGRSVWKSWESKG